MPVVVNMYHSFTVVEEILAGVKWSSFAWLFLYIEPCITLKIDSFYVD